MSRFWSDYGGLYYISPENYFFFAFLHYENQRLFFMKLQGRLFSAETLRESTVLRVLQMTSEPPLGGSIRAFCASKLSFDVIIMAKVVFFIRRASLCIKLTGIIGGWAVSMEEALVKTLPEANRDVHARVSTNIDVFHFLALVYSNKINDVDWSPWNFHACNLGNRRHISGSCMLLASGWSDPAETSFAPNSGGKDSSCGRFHSLERWSWKGSSGKREVCDKNCWRTSLRSRQIQAPTVDRNKQDNRYRWCRRACTCHTQTYLF